MNTIAVCTLNVAPQIMKQIQIVKCHSHYNFEATRVSGKFQKPSTLQPFLNTARFLKRKASCICLTSTPYSNGRIWSVISKTPTWNPGTQLNRRIAPRLQQRVSESLLIPLEDFRMGRGGDWPWCLGLTASWDKIHCERWHCGISLYFDLLICLVLKYIMPAENQSLASAWTWLITKKWLYEGFFFIFGFSSIYILLSPTRRSICNV